MHWRWRPAPPGSVAYRAPLQKLGGIDRPVPGGDELPAVALLLQLRFDEVRAHLGLFGELLECCRFRAAKDELARKSRRSGRGHRNPHIHHEDAQPIPPQNLGGEKLVQISLAAALEVEAVGNLVHHVTQVLLLGDASHLDHLLPDELLPALWTRFPTASTSRAAAS